MEEKFAELKEERIFGEMIFEGRVMRVVRDTVRLPNGHESTREVVLHDGAVAVIPLLPDGSVLMERQYRYAQGRTVLEIPAGKLDSPDEPPLAAAIRELKEETGATAETMTPLGIIVPSVAILTEKIHLYLAEGLTFGQRKLDEDEFLNVERIPLDELMAMTERGEIQDSKTQIAVMKAWLLLQKRRAAEGTSL